MDGFVTGLVLAAGRSTRLGRPKQLLDVGGRPLLAVTLDMARACGFDQLVVALGGAGHDVREAVDLSGCTVVDNVRYTTGCSSSIVAALDHVDPRAVGLVLLLGDQPGIDHAAVAAVTAAAVAVDGVVDGVGHVPGGSVPGDGGETAGAGQGRTDQARTDRAPIAVCRYDDGRGHPFWFSRAVFSDLAGLHGDKAVWKLLESGRWPVVEVRVPGPVPLDVDTWDDYRRLLDSTP